MSSLSNFDIFKRFSPRIFKRMKKTQWNVRFSAIEKDGANTWSE